MSNTIAYVDNQTLTNIADAVRYKTGTNGKMLLSDIPDKIRNIDGIIPSGSIKIDANGVYDVTEKVEVDVNVNPDPYMGDTEVTPSAETQVLATKKKFVQDDITVLPAPTETLSTTSNGQFTPSSGKVGFSSVTVDVNPDLRPLSISENGSYEPDGFDGYSSVIVNNPAQWTSKGLAEGTEPYGDIDLGDVTTVNMYAFFEKPITKVIGNSVKSINTGAFEKCDSLEYASFPLAAVGQRCFIDCTSLVELHIPRTITVPTSAMVNTGIEFLYLPSLRSVGSNCFQNNKNLEKLILPACTSLYANHVFDGSENLKAILIGGNGVAGVNINSINDTPFAQGGSGVEIYIPKALYDHLGDGSNLDYLQNSVWNTLNSYGTITWHPIEGSEYETYMPGGAKYEEEMALT